MAGLSVSYRVVTLPDCDLDKQDWGAATGLWCCFFSTEKWNSPPYALARVNENIFLAKNKAGFTWETLCDCNRNHKSSDNVLCCDYKDALFFLFPLWLSSSKPLKLWFILRAAPFLCEHIFGVTTATCLHYLYVPHYSIYVHYASGNMWNQLFPNKKKPMWMIKKVSACLHLRGVSSPSSALQQLSEAAAAVAHLAVLVFCKAAALLEVETQKGRCVSAK